MAEGCGVGGILGSGDVEVVAVADEKGLLEGTLAAAFIGVEIALKEDCRAVDYVVVGHGAFAAAGRCRRGQRGLGFAIPLLFYDDSPLEGSVEKGAVTTRYGPAYGAEHIVAIYGIVAAQHGVEGPQDVCVDAVDIGRGGICKPMREVVGVDEKEGVGRCHGWHEPVEIANYLGGDAAHLVAFARWAEICGCHSAVAAGLTQARYKGNDGGSVVEIDLSEIELRIQHCEKIFSSVEDFDIVGRTHFNRSRQNAWKVDEKAFFT